MKIDYPDGCEQEWRQSLSPWQRQHLADIHRMGRGLRDGTNHGSDYRWRQVGVKTRDSWGNWKRTGDGDRGAHTRIMVTRTDYGYIMDGLRPSTVTVIDPETGVMTRVEGYVIAWRWYVQESRSSNYPPRREEEVVAA